MDAHHTPVHTHRFGRSPRRSARSPGPHTASRRFAPAPGIRNDRGLPARTRGVVARLRLARTRAVAGRAPAVPRRHRRRDDPLRPSARGPRGCSRLAGDARLAAHVRAAAGVRRPAARLPRGRRESPRVRVLDAVRRGPDHRTAPRSHDAPADDRRSGLRALPDLRRGRLSECERPHRGDLSGLRVRHPGHPCAFPVDRGAEAVDPVRRACLLRAPGPSSTAQMARTVMCRRPGPTPSRPH